MKGWGEGLLSSECDTPYNSHQQNAWCLISHAFACVKHAKQLQD